MQSSAFKTSVFSAGQKQPCQFPQPLLTDPKTSAVGHKTFWQPSRKTLFGFPASSCPSVGGEPEIWHLVAGAAQQAKGEGDNNSLDWIVPFLTFHPVCGSLADSDSTFLDHFPVYNHHNPKSWGD